MNQYINQETIIPHWHDFPFSSVMPSYQERDDIWREMQTCFNRIKATKKYSPVILSGDGGVGKSTSVIRWAIENGYATVRWMKMMTPNLIEDSLEKLFIDLKIDPQEKREKKLKEVAYFLKSQENWLIVFDGVLNCDVIQDLLPFFDGSATKHLLITSRDLNSWEEYGEYLIPVGGYANKDAKSYIKKQLSRPNKKISYTEKEMEDLIIRLHKNPLMLEVALENIPNKYASIPAILEDLQKKGITALARPKQKQVNQRNSRQINESNDLLTLVGVSSLTEKHALLIHIISLMSTSKISIDFFNLYCAEKNITESDDFIDFLTTRVFIKSYLKHNKRYFYMHDLMKEAVQENARSEWRQNKEELKAALLLSLNLIEQSFFDDEDYPSSRIREGLAHCIFLKENVLRLFESEDCIAQWVANISILIAQAQRILSRYIVAGETLKDSLEYYQNLGDPAAFDDMTNKVGWGRAKIEHALLLREQGDIVKAQLEFLHIAAEIPLEVREDNQDLNMLKASVACHLGNIESDINTTDSLIKAREYYEKSQKLYDACGATHAMADILHNLGELCLQEKKYPEAWSYYQQSLAIDGDSPTRKGSIAVTYDSLGMWYYAKNNVQRDESLSEKHLQRALELKHECLQESEPDNTEKVDKISPTLATTKDHLGVLCRKQNKLLDAEKWHIEALKNYYTIYGNYWHINIAEVLLNLGNLHSQSESLSQAAACYHSAKSIFTKTNRALYAKKMDYIALKLEILDAALDVNTLAKSTDRNRTLSEESLALAMNNLFRYSDHSRESMTSQSRNSITSTYSNDKTDAEYISAYSFDPGI